MIVAGLRKCMRAATKPALLAGAVAALLLRPASGLSLILGDSYFTDRNAIPDALNRYSGGQFVSAAVGGASVHEGEVASVPDEWYSVKNNNHWNAVVVNAGANDLITYRNNCYGVDETCQRVIKECGDLYWNMVNDMHNSGVGHIIFLGFIPVEGLDRAFDAISDKFIGICNSSPVPCSYVDLRYPPVALGPDRNHPSTDGYEDVAHRIWQVKLDNNIQL